MASNENNDETFGEGFAIETQGALEDSSPSTDGKYTCKICSEKYCNPRVLSCLHVFCQGCLDKQLMDESGDSKAGGGIITCPECEQETKVKSNGAASLPCDYVMTNVLDLCAIQDMALVCTSCKTKKLAMSRCSECAQYLCANCNTAHQLMRCFEDHHVVDFEDIRKSALEPNEPVPIHKPIFCVSHPNEKLKFFCYTCEVPICNDCIVSEHVAPQHRCKRLEDALPRQREELEKLMKDTKSTTTLCHDVSASLENALSELQQQHDNAKDLILETYQSYKAILEKCKEERLQELKSLHTERELKIMDTCHTVEKTSEKIEDACKFTTQLLKHGNAVEILSLKNVVSVQLQNIISHTPKPAVNFNLKFVTAMSAFENAVQATFGAFCGSEESSSAPTTAASNEPATPPVTTTTFSGASAATSMVNGDFSPSPTFSATGFSGVPQRSSSAGFAVTSGSSMMNGYPSSVTSSPVSMQSSYDGEIGQITGFGVSSSVLHSPETPAALPPKRELIRIREYNLHQLANLADKEMETPASPANSPTPPMLLTEILSSAMNSQSHAFNNLQALAKLGNFSVNDQGALVVASQSVPSPPSPPINNPSSQVLGTLLNDLTTDTMNASLNGSQALMGCGRSSPSSMGLASPSLSINTTFPGMAGSTSILTQTDDLLPEPCMSGFGSPLSPQFPVSGGVYAHPRDPSGKTMPMQVRLKFGQMGSTKGQFNSPHGFCLGWDEDIVVADTNNHRIQVFEKNGMFKFQFGVAGKEEGLLYYPRKVAVIRESGKFVVCDRGNERSRLQTFTKNGHFIRKIAIRYIEILAGLAVTRNGNIVAVDSVSPTVFVIAESGEIITWFNCSDYMMEPSDITVWGNEFFVCDFKGHAVVVFGEDGSFKRRIGREPVTSYPNGIDISDAGDVLVGDSHGNRFHIVVFNRQGEKLSEFECPYVKVSRCCGLKITSEGYVVTVAKNNHHVLVLNTLYIH